MRTLRALHITWGGYAPQWSGAGVLAQYAKYAIIRPSHCAGVAQLVERNLAKVEVASSRLVSRSRFQKGSPDLPGFPFLLTRGSSARSWCCRYNGGAVSPRRGGRVVMQRPAKPCTPVRFRPPPPRPLRGGMTPMAVSGFKRSVSSESHLCIFTVIWGLFFRSAPPRS